MNEESVDLTVEEETDRDIEEFVEQEIITEDLEQDIEIYETTEIVEVEEAEEIYIEVNEAIGWVGGDSTRHYSLYGRDEFDQHPIRAITGLREELNEIERLKTVYSDDRNQANYYLWEDENILQEDRIGYFVSVRSDINEIGICASESDIFGVTVDGAGFIGAQSDIPRDYKYGLVVHNGIVHVRCELSVNVGDYVVSNDYGYAKSNKNGYKVIGRHQIDGVEYAEITLVTPIELICKLSDNVDSLNERVDDAEINIVAAMNVANAAYNKAGEASNVSEEAVKEAIEALKKSNETADKIDELESNLSSTNELAVQAKAISESAAVSAEAIRKDAVDTADKALADVNNLIDDLEPIIMWEDPITKNVGSEYFVTYIKDGVATQAQIQAVESLTEDNKSAIEKSAEEFSSFVSSVDKYSVGEYSQSYGLTREQAKSILKEGMIYVPTKHSDEKRSHQETFSDDETVNEFTPGCYYTWDGNDWIESQPNLVAFFSEVPVPNDILIYWYVDSNEAPEGYEPYALYMYNGEQWVKVNMLAGNVNNRVTSMIRQTADKIALDVANAQDGVASHQQWLDNNSANIQDVVSWKSDVENDVSQIATIKQTADDAGASIALVVEEKDGEKVINGGSIAMAINNQTGDSIIKLNADVVDIEAGDISLKGQTIKLDADDGVVAIESKNFNVDSDGNIEAKAGTIGGWTITDDYLQSENQSVGLSGTSADWAFWAGYDASNGDAKFQVKSDGSLKATTGEIGGWYISTNEIGCGSVHGGGTGIILSTEHGIIVRKSTGESTSDYQDSFHADTHGNVTITGTINATNGNFSDSVTIGGTSINGYNLRRLYSYATTGSGTQINYVNATGGSVGGWKIDSESLYYDDGYNKRIRLGGLNGLYVYEQGATSTLVYASWEDIAIQCKNAASSDRNVKNSITTFDYKYDIFFDNLIPCSYKYNYDTSNQYHNGYVAQDVVKALEDAGLESQDFSAVVHLDYPTSKGSEWLLYKEEFIALNTWQIQKAKARITELENKVAELEELIKGE